MSTNDEKFSGLILALNDLLNITDPKDAVYSMVQMVERGDLHDAIVSMLVNGAIKIRNNDLLHLSATENEKFRQNFRSAELPAGLLSHDASAVMGRSGFVFLIGGSNDVIGQYNIDFPDSDILSQKWLNLIELRINEATRRGILFHQLVIPEKITIIPEYFPFIISIPTTLLQRLEAGIVNEGKSSYYISGRELLCGQIDRSKFCKKTDSHLSPAGSFVLFKCMMKKLLDYDVGDFHFDHPVSSIGDMVLRMRGVYLAEEYMETSVLSLPSFISSAYKIADNKSSVSAHMGRTQVWRNDASPIKKKVVVFGNSFFSIVENGQSNLSWWFSGWFEEFHFVWTNEVHWDYVDEVMPDIVIWQGIERFLPIVPSS